MMTEPEVFVLSEKALNAVIQQIKDEQWQMKADELSWRGPANLREIINYHAYDSIWVADTLAGKTIEEVGKKYDGDLLGDDPKAAYADVSRQAIEATKALSAADLDRQVHLTYGDFPVREYLKHITSFRGFRSYSIAELIGADSAMPAELVDGLWDEVVPQIDGWRKMGVFGPAIDPPADADKQTKLLCLTGFYKQ